MQFLKNKLIILLATFLLITSANQSFAYTTAPACIKATKGGSSIVEIAVKMVATMYNIFPVRIGAVKISIFGGLEDYNDLDNVPVCKCLVPLPRIGIKLSLWEPVAIEEQTALPMCFPSLGLNIPLAVGLGAMSVGEQSAQSGTEQKTLNTYQTHHLKFPGFMIFNLLTDLMCLETGDFAIGTFSEIDPLHQNDIWAAIAGPEAFLVANAPAQLACIVDSAAAGIGFPLDPLWWCLGSWGSMFPMTMNVEGTSNITATATLTSRNIMKLHRVGLLWGNPTNSDGLCTKIPMPIMRKSQYGQFPVYPIGWPTRIPTGRTGMLWEAGQDVPITNMHVWAWAVYSKRNCCAF